MQKHANYMILPELRLILECCKNQALVEDAINMKKAEMADELYNPEYNILVDFREFVTIIDPSVLVSTRNFFDFLKSMNIKGKIALLTAKPVQVVVSLTLKKLFKELKSPEIDVFSTIPGAVNYLKFPFESVGIIESKIKLLNSNTI